MTAGTDERTWTRHSFAAMGTAVTVEVRADHDVSALTGTVEGLFAGVERSCTRFRDDSDLMRANAHPESNHLVSTECAAIVDAAYDAYLMTGGLFDPRILQQLVSAGYDRTFDDVPPESLSASATPGAAPMVKRWRPTVDAPSSTVELGPTPIDLGGIGKGWTVDAAARIVAADTTAFLVNAGGDLAVGGDGPDGDGWTVAVEDPTDPAKPLAVLKLHDQSCATSSTGRRHWIKDGQERHHLIDPRTGTPAQGGLRAVTVVAASTTTAEVWSKALLIAGRGDIAAICRDKDLAAYWITTDDVTEYSSALTPSLIWERNGYVA